MKFDKTYVVALAILLIIISFFLATPISKNPQIIPTPSEKLELNNYQIVLAVDGPNTSLDKTWTSKIIILDENLGTFTEFLISSSNFSHKALIVDIDNDGINELIGIGGDRAIMKLYKIKESKIIDEEIIWNTTFRRIRDVEFGDLNGDGKPELVAVTHEEGVVGILSYLNSRWEINEINNLFGEETFIHEVEIGDVDNDGENEFVTTPSFPNIRKNITDSNQSKKPNNQPGKISVFNFLDNKFQETIIDSFADSPVKEIVIGDLDNDGKNELIASKRGIKVNGTLVENMKILMYNFDSIKNEFIKKEIFSIDDFKSRGMTFSDVDGDGLNELVIGTELKGLLILSESFGKWKYEVIDSSIKEVNSVYAFDFDGDMKDEIIAASNENSKVYIYKKDSDSWEKRMILELPENTKIWAIDVGRLNN